ncbi:hypothetical protein Tco_1338601 [Tanacetum coccineum]
MLRSSSVLDLLKCVGSLSWRESSDFYWKSEIICERQMCPKIRERIGRKNLLLMSRPKLPCQSRRDNGVASQGFATRHNHGALSWYNLSATCHSKDSGPSQGLYLCRIVLRYHCIRTELITPNLICLSTYQLLQSSGDDSGPDMSYDKLLERVVEENRRIHEDLKL